MHQTSYEVACNKHNIFQGNCDRPRLFFDNQGKNMNCNVLHSQRKNKQHCRCLDRRGGIEDKIFLVFVVFVLLSGGLIWHHPCSVQKISKIIPLHCWTNATNSCRFSASLPLYLQCTLFILYISGPLKYVKLYRPPRPLPV